MKKHLILSALIIIFSNSVYSQNGYWQQRVEYEMDIDFNVNTHRFTGDQEVVYYNNSPDTLHRVFYHLYFNAFQPGSMMDVRSRTIEDADSRVGDRISKLTPEEQGYIHVTELFQNGKPVTIKEDGTVLIVDLEKPVLPGKKVTFNLKFEAQVPAQVRRSGRDNAEGVAYSMTQWYPKIAEYDEMGWHADPYIAREFHSVWGDFDVKIKIDSSFTIGGTGILQNPEEIGHGYELNGKKLKRPEGDNLIWHFKAENVLDFAWAADPDYVHIVTQMDDGPELHFFYKDEAELEETWTQLPQYTEKLFAYANEHFGKYPYKAYSVLQGGDGGMEYPMATLITGKRNLGSLVGVTVHEVMHSWYQMVLATNESLYPWMDEGFTTYASNRVMDHLFERPKKLAAYYSGYFSLANSTKEEPMSTHADHYQTNFAYGAAAYNKGAVFVDQLGYIMGDSLLDITLRRYYNDWKFKHPTPQDFIRVAEKVSNIELDWYLQYMVNSTHTIDYAVKALRGNATSTTIDLQRIGNFPMPVDLVVILTDGSQANLNIPLRIMRGSKSTEKEWLVVDAWPWTNTEYRLTMDIPVNEILSVMIDPTGRMADIDPTNDFIEIEQGEEQIYINN